MSLYNDVTIYYLEGSSKCTINVCFNVFEILEFQRIFFSLQIKVFKQAAALLSPWQQE